MFCWVFCWVFCGVFCGWKWTHDPPLTPLGASGIPQVGQLPFASGFRLSGFAGHVCLGTRRMMWEMLSFHLMTGWYEVKWKSSIFPSGVMILSPLFSSPSCT